MRPSRAGNSIAIPSIAPVAPAHIVTGNGSPSPNGYYLRAGSYNGADYFTNGNFFLWLWVIPHIPNFWFLSTAVGNPLAGFINGYNPNQIQGTYVATGAATGTATVV